MADVGAAIAFVLIGRASHHEDDALVGFLRTLWPFVVGLAVGWAYLVRRAAPSTEPVAGLLVGVATAVVGLALRAVSGQGIAASFLVVAVVVLTVFMTGWRAVAALARSLSARRRGPAS